MNPERIAYPESRIAALSKLDGGIVMVFLRLAEADLDFERRNPRTDYRLPERRKPSSEGALE